MTGASKLPIPLQQGLLNLQQASRASLTNDCNVRLFSPRIHLTNKNKFKVSGYPHPVLWEDCKQIIMKYDIVPARTESVDNPHELAAACIRWYPISRAGHLVPLDLATMKREQEWQDAPPEVCSEVYAERYRGMEKGAHSKIHADDSLLSTRRVHASMWALVSPA